MLTSSYQLCLKHRPGFFKCEKADQPEDTAGESEVRPGPSNLIVSRRGRYYITPTIGESPSLLLFNLFSSEIVWPQSIFTRFATIPFNPRKNDYYAPYNKLLNVLFPPDSPFTVEPQSRLIIAESREPIDFLVEYQVLWENANVPVFILEIETGPKLGLVSVREADIRIRKRLRDLISFCPLSKLHAVSAIGTKLCFYTAEAGRVISPLRIVADDHFAIDTAPLERWDCDVLEVERAARLKAIVHEIQQECAQLDSV